MFQTSPFCPYRVPDITTWSYQTHVFHLLITSWHIFPVHYFTLAPFFAFSLIRWSYINKSFSTRMSYLLPHAKFQRVTFFIKRSYHLPRENFKLPYLLNQAHWDPGICSQLRSSHIHSIHQKSSDFINGNFVYLALICAVWSSRGRAGKKVTAVTFFRCPTVMSQEWEGWLTLNKRDRGLSFMTITMTFWWPRWSVRIYQTVTGVTLVVDVLLTHLVRFQLWSVDFPLFGSILTFK